MARVRPSRRNDVTETTNKYGRPNGEGDWTVHRAHDEHMRLRTSARPPDLRGKRTQAQLLAEQEWKLRNLRAELYIEDDPVRRAKLEKNISIKREFIAVLRGKT